jgi:hypothetical protein
MRKGSITLAQSREKIFINITKRANINSLKEAEEIAQVIKVAVEQDYNTTLEGPYLLQDRKRGGEFEGHLWFKDKVADDWVARRKPTPYKPHGKPRDEEAGLIDPSPAPGVEFTKQRDASNFDTYRKVFGPGYDAAVDEHLRGGINVSRMAEGIEIVKADYGTDILASMITRHHRESMEASASMSNFIASTIIQGVRPELQEIKASLGGLPLAQSLNNLASMFIAQRRETDELRKELKELKAQKTRVRRKRKKSFHPLNLDFFVNLTRGKLEGGDKFGNSNKLRL